jgi:hypothetical protein
MYRGAARPPVAAPLVAGRLRVRAASATDEFVAGYSSVWVPRMRGLSTPNDRRIAN